MQIDREPANESEQVTEQIYRNHLKVFVSYDSKEQCLHINGAQYFEPVPIELWEYPIGGYQVLAKRLKDRNDRRLTMEEIQTFCRVVTAIKETIALQEEIDALYAAAEKGVIGMGTGS